MKYGALFLKKLKIKNKVSYAAILLDASGVYKTYCGYLLKCTCYSNITSTHSIGLYEKKKKNYALCKICGYIPYKCVIMDFMQCLISKVSWALYTVGKNSDVIFLVLKMELYVFLFFTFFFLIALVKMIGMW